MHILYLHQQFQTRNSPTGIRSYEFARHLLRHGHRVTMICSGIAAEPQLAIPDGRRYWQTEVDGIECVPIAAAWSDPRVLTAVPGARRMLGFLHFAHLAARVGRKLTPPDLVFATHTPLPIGLAGKSLARHFRVPFVFEVRDLWPQALINLGVLRNPAIIWWMRRMERSIYRAADHIVALSPGMAAGVRAAGVAAEKITLIPNAADVDLFHPGVDGSAFRQQHQLEDRFVALYFGAMGLANGLDYVLQAARHLQEQGDRRIVLVLLGDGHQKSSLQASSRALGLRNVLFADSVPKAQMPGVVAASDACLVIFRAIKENNWSPNKMFDALAAGKPVITNAPGWLTELVEQGVCGTGVDPARPETLADALCRLAASPDTCRAMGQRARQLAEDDFSRDRLARRLERVFEQAVARRRETPAPRPDQPPAAPSWPVESQLKS